MTLAILLWSSLVLPFQTGTEGRLPCLPDTYMAFVGPNSSCLPCLHSKHWNHLSTLPISASTISTEKTNKCYYCSSRSNIWLFSAHLLEFPYFLISNRLMLMPGLNFLAQHFIFSLNSCNYLKWFDALDEFEEVMAT